MKGYGNGIKCTDIWLTQVSLKKGGRPSTISTTSSLIIVQREEIQVEGLQLQRAKATGRACRACKIKF